MNISSTNTVTQQATATWKRFPPNHAARIPIRSAAAPARGDCVASIIAGKVITESVT